MPETARSGRWLAVALPFGLYLAHAALFGSWIVDDAAIGFVYAQNLAEGHGLVSQPGAEPVEGYSDFLWVVLFVPFVQLGLFHPVLTPKLLSVGFILLTFLVLRRCMRQFLDAGEWAVALALTLLALNSSFVVWTVSGLENPLYVLLAVALLWRVLTVAAAPMWTLCEGVRCGTLAVAIALTRPDGVLYAVAAPVVVLGCWFVDRRGRRVGDLLRFVLANGSTFALLFGGFLAFRILYFHDLVPNTYHAKSASTGELLRQLVTLHPDMGRKLLGLFDCVLGVRLRPFILALLGVAALGAVGMSRLRRGHIVGLVFLVLSALAFLLLPIDWMPLFRFATPFIVFFTGLWVALAGECLRSVSWPMLRRVLAAAVSLAALAWTLDYYGSRTARFREHPTVPWDVIAEVYGERFNEYADRLGVADGSLLLPDLGGTLTRSRLRVYDLAGLCDRTTGRTLERDPAAYRDYVFEVARPTFIHSHDHWTWVADLQGDSRFRRDYLPLFEIEDPWITRHFGRRLCSGDWVRREAVAGKEVAYTKLCKECRKFWDDFLHAPHYQHLFPLIEAVQEQRSAELR